MEITPLSSLRAQAQLTQREIAKQARLSDSAYIDIELQRVRSRMLSRQRIVEALNVAFKTRGIDRVIGLSDIDWSKKQQPQGTSKGVTE